MRSRELVEVGTENYLFKKMIGGKEMIIPQSAPSAFSVLNREANKKLIINSVEDVLDENVFESIK